MSNLPRVLVPAADDNRPDDEVCPWCGQRISHEKFDEIHKRIEGEKRKKNAEFERRLQQRVALDRAQADANAKAHIEKVRQEADTKVRVASEAAKKAAQAAVKPKLDEAEKAKRAAEKQLETIKKSQQALLTQRLQEQRSALEKDKADAVNTERSKMFKEKLKLEEKLQLMQRLLQSKTADELGEGAEINLFEALRDKFPQDEVTRVGKGKEGADIIHKITDGHRACGFIVYDSKNRNAWRNEYVSKLCRDQLAAKADHAVLATHVFPAGARQLHIQDGVIVSNPARILVIIEMIRKHMIQIHTLQLSTESRNEKMATLYDFITSDRCTQLLDQIESQTDDMLEIDVKEKKTHDATWQRRGELIRSVQRVRLELSSEIDRIVGEPAADRAAQAT